MLYSHVRYASFTLEMTDLSFHWWKFDEENNHRKRRKNPWRSKPNRCNTAGRPWGNRWESPRGWCFKNRHVFRSGFHIPYSSGFDITPIQSSNEVDTLNCLFSNVHLFTYERCSDLSSDETMYTIYTIVAAMTYVLDGWLNHLPCNKLAGFMGLSSGGPLWLQRFVSGARG